MPVTYDIKYSLLTDPKKAVNALDKLMEHLPGLGKTATLPQITIVNNHFRVTLEGGKIATEQEIHLDLQ